MPAGRADQMVHIRRMSESIRRSLEPLTRTGQVNISEGAHGITVEINASLLFSAGESALQIGAQSPLRAIAQVFAAGDFSVVLEGHAESTPICTAHFPSKRELSSAPASSIVRVFANSGIPPARLSAVGDADHRPIAENLTEEGGARNRRARDDPPRRHVQRPAAASAVPSPPERSALHLVALSNAFSAQPRSVARWCAEVGVTAFRLTASRTALP